MMNGSERFMRLFVGFVLMWVAGFVIGDASTGFALAAIYTAAVQALTVLLDMHLTGK